VLAFKTFPEIGGCTAHSYPKQLAAAQEQFPELCAYIDLRCVLALKTFPEFGDFLRTGTPSSYQPCRSSSLNYVLTLTCAACWLLKRFLNLGISCAQVPQAAISHAGAVP